MRLRDRLPSQASSEVLVPRKELGKSCLLLGQNCDILENVSGNAPKVSCGHTHCRPLHGFVSSVPCCVDLEKKTVVLLFCFVFVCFPFECFLFTFLFFLFCRILWNTNRGIQHFGALRNSVSPESVLLYVDMKENCLLIAECRCCCLLVFDLLRIFEVSQSILASHSHILQRTERVKSLCSTWAFAPVLQRKKSV